MHQRIAWTCAVVFVVAMLGFAWCSGMARAKDGDEAESDLSKIFADDDETELLKRADGKRKSKDDKEDKDGKGSRARVMLNLFATPTGTTLNAKQQKAFDKLKAKEGKAYEEMLDKIEESDPRSPERNTLTHELHEKRDVIQHGIAKILQVNYSDYMKDMAKQREAAKKALAKQQQEEERRNRALRSRGH